MALSKTNNEEVPKDAVIITEDQALRYQWKIVTGWEKLSEVWSLRYTSGLLSIFAAGTGVYVNNHYRNKLNLGTYGRFSSYLPIVVVPAIFTTLAHKFFIQRPILLEPMEHCPICLQIRAATFQTAMGVIYPTLLAPLAGFMFATRYYTYRLPSLTQQPMEIINLWRKFTKPITPTLTTIILAQTLITMYLTSKEEDQNFNLLLKLKEMERKIDEEQLQNQNFDK